MMETQEKLKRGSKELNRKLQNMKDEQVRGRGMVMTVTRYSDEEERDDHKSCIQNELRKKQTMSDFVVW